MEEEWKLILEMEERGGKNLITVLKEDNNEHKKWIERRERKKW